MASVFPVHNSVLASEALTARVLSKYPLRQPVSCRFFRRSVTDVYEVTTGRGPCWLKVYTHGRRSRSDVAEEVHLLNYLRRRGACVVKPLSRADGAFISAIPAPEGTRYAVLYQNAAGRTMDHKKPRDLRVVGQAVGQIHNICDGLKTVYRRRPIDLEFLVDHHLPIIQPFMEHRPKDFELIRSIGEDVKAKITSLLSRQTPEFGICHGDLHGDIRIDKNHRPTILDFDSFGYGWRAIDLGILTTCSHWMGTDEKSQDSRRSRLDAVLSGYQRERRLNRGEMDALWLAPPVYHIFLMGLVLEHTVHREGSHWADDNFINWHMKWFRHWAETNRVL